ncbi:O-antigen ligase family protein [Desulfocastanea catecholica]
MKYSYRLFLFLLIFAPLAFGTVELWSLATLELLTGVAALLLVLPACFYRKKLYVVPGALPLLLLLFFMLLQLLPLPVAVVRFLSPSTYAAYAPVLSLTGGEWIPLTINQKATLQEFLRIACYGLFYVLTVQLLSISGRLKKTVFLVVGLAAAIALLAIVQQMGSPEKIYWLRAVPDNASPFGPWINPNQFAGFMEMISPLALALFLFYRPRVHGRESLREKVVGFFTMPGSNLYLFLGCAATLMALSVFVSLCRGGILTITLSAFVFMLLYNMKRPKHGRAAILVIIGCVVMFVSWFGWDTVIAEFNHGITRSGELDDGRFALWADSRRIIGSFFLFGSGFGTFVDIFPAYRSFPGYHIFDHAHNDYLELLTDGGIIGFALAAWFVLAVLHHGWTMIRARRDQYAVLLGIGAFTGIIAMLMHSVTDFNMHNGADGLYFFFFCGLLVAVVNTRFDYCGTTTLLPKQSGKQNVGLLTLALLMTVVTLLVQYGTLRARTEYGKVQGIYVNRQLSDNRRQELIDGVSRAQWFDPLEHRYPFKLATIEWTVQNPARSLAYFLQAARRMPMHGVTLQSIGLLVDDQAQAAMLLEQGARRGQDDDELALTLAEFLLQKGERAKAVEVIGERLQRTPALAKKWAPLFSDFSFSRAEIDLLLADSVDDWIAYGEYLHKMGDGEEAGYYFATALFLLEGTEELKPQWFDRLIRFYRENGQPQQALLLLRQAVELLPDYAPFHVQLGDYYRTEGITFRAREEYQRALMLDPGSKVVQKKLRQMGLSDSY